MVALAPEVLLAVLGPHLDAVDAAMAPGLGLLTWTSLNIDVYLHRVHQVLTPLPVSNPGSYTASCSAASSHRRRASFVGFRTLLSWTAWSGYGSWFSQTCFPPLDAEPEPHLTLVHCNIRAWRGWKSWS